MSKAGGKCKCPEGEECPEWIFTFADLVMLMMGFFVVLWVTKPQGEPKKEEGKTQVIDENWLETIGQIRGGFGWEPNPQSNDPVDKAVLKRRAMNGPGENGRALRKAHGADGTDQEVLSVRPGKHATVGGRVLFDAGKAELTPEAAKILDDVVLSIRGYENIIVVKGHAGMDDLPEDAGDRQRMALSVRRAEVVADYLVSHGVAAETLRVQGCSTYEPVKERAYSPDVRLLNRRVEIEGTDTLVVDRKDLTRKSASDAGEPKHDPAAPAHDAPGPDAGHTEPHH